MDAVSDCLDDDTLLDFIAGRLSAGRAGEIDDHVAGCEECRRLLAALARGQVIETPQTAAPEPAEPFEPGATVGSFAIMRRLGRGGMGEVFLARDTQLGRKVALKIIRSEQLGSAAARERFLFEARTTARFNHPHIVTVYAVGEHDGHPYLALEYLQGQTLALRLEEERLGLPDVLRIGQAVADALCEAHSHGVLHRDLKPANVVIPRDGRVRVLDFGLAKSVEPTGAGEEQEQDASPDGLQLPGQTARLTGLQFESHGGGLRGTPAYMAPEQWLDEACTPATDIWALGVMLHQMVSGRVPFKAPLGLLRTQVTAGTPPALQHAEAEACGLVRLIQRCLQREPAERPTADEMSGALAEMLAGRRAEGSLEGSPFRGLSPFGEHHAAHFYGRDRELGALLEQLRERAVLPIAGPSGVGKSSLVRAGIFPRLRERGDWTLLAMRPGRQPLTALAERLVFGESTARSGSAPGTPDDEDWSRVRQIEQELASSTDRLSALLYRAAQEQGRKVLLFVDQLEELFTHEQDAALCSRLVQMLFTAADHPQDPVRVVLAVRDDFLYRVVESAGELGEASQVAFVRSPDTAAMREILWRPLQAVGYAFDDQRLVDEIIADVQTETASLPLLQFAAQALWERRDRQRHQLRRADYAAMGGVGGALARYADGVLEALSPSQVRLARDLLLRLVTAEDTRRVVAEVDLLEGLGSEAAVVLQRLTGQRLVTTRKSRRTPAPDAGRAAELELVHEALIHNWARLKRWVEEERESIGQLAEASQAAELWERRGGRQEEVWAGEALGDARRLLRLPGARVPAQVRRFLEAGLALDRRRRRRRATGRGLVLGALALAALVAIIVAGFVTRKKREADRLRSIAERQLAAAQLRGAHLALLQQRITEARVKLRASLEIEDTMAARALWRSLQREPLFFSHRLPSVVFAVAFGPDGRQLATAGRDGAVHLLDIASRSSRALHRHDQQILSLAFSPDRRWLASGDVTGAVRLHDLRTHRGRTRSLTGAASAVWRLAFAPDGALWAVGGAGGSLVVWRPGDDRLRRWPGAGAQRLNSLALDPVGERVAGGCSDGAVGIWNRRSGAEIRRLTGHRGRVYAVAFDARGRRLASASADRTIRLWDSGSGALLHTLRGHSDTVFDLRFSPDGKLLASSSHDRTVRLWESTSGAQRQVLRGHNAMVFGLGFAPDGRLLASGGYDHTVRVWRTDRPREPGPVGGHSSAVLEASFSPDGRVVASASGDRTVRLWDAHTGLPLGELRGHGNSVSAVRFSPRGDLLATASYDQTVRLWDLATRSQLARLEGHTDKIRGLAFSSDGRWIASAGEDRSVRLWDVERRAAGPVMVGHAATVASVAFSPDGRWLASTAMDRTIRLWPVGRKASPVVLQVRGTLLDGARFSPDGRRLAALGGDGRLHVWSAGTWAEEQPVPGAGRGVRFAFHPGGARVGVGTVTDARLIDLAPGGRHLRLAGHRGEVNSFAFDQKGRLAVTASDDDTVRTWRTDTGAPHWRAPLLLARPVELFTHRGWKTLDGASRPSPTDAAWRRAVAQGARSASAWHARTGATPATLCLLRHDGVLELWSPAVDRRELSIAMKAPQRVLALPDACALQAEPGVILVRPGAEPRQLTPAGGRLLGRSDSDGLLVGVEKQVRVLGPDGSTHRQLPMRGRPTAACLSGERLVLGHANGSVSPSTPPLEQTPSTAVTRMLCGPRGLVIVGHADGVVGIWELKSGARLAHGRLHGPVTHLLLQRQQLYAVSELGDHLQWRLEPLFMPYCRLMGKVWRDVPIVAAGSGYTRRAPPPGHRCAR